MRRAARWLEGRLRRQLRARARLTIRPFTTPTVPVSDPGQVATSSAYRLGSHPTWSLAVAFPLCGRALGRAVRTDLRAADQAATTLAGNVVRSGPRDRRSASDSATEEEHR